MIKVGFVLMAIAAALFFSGTPGSGTPCVITFVAGLTCLGFGQLALWAKILRHKP